MFRVWIGLALVAGISIFAVRHYAKPSGTTIAVSPQEVAADGYSEATVTVHSGTLPKLTSSNRGIHIGRLRQTSDDTWTAVIRAGVLPGNAKLIASSSTGQAEVPITLRSYVVDRDSNGTPDAVKLDAEQDQLAFRRWFTFLSEAQFFQHEDARPPEITDCAALIRYAYREALKQHDEIWAKDAKLPLIRAIPSVEKYRYPYTPLAPALFRVKAGGFDPNDSAAFSQFADAQTLQRFNTHMVSRDIRRAQPGDLLFYRHDLADLPFHGMIYIGRSQVQSDNEEVLLVYHTGPDQGRPGEIRRPTASELLVHPNPEWRPVPGNPSFLGVFRWNILP